MNADETSSPVAARHLPWVDDDTSLLLVDQYELTMIQGYLAEEMHDTAVFSLFVRRLPEGRNYLTACGLETVLSWLEGLHASRVALDHLARSGFGDQLLEWLSDLRFTGDVHAVPEGTPIFPDEPLLEVEAPLPQAQLVETFVMNQIHLQTVLASKAARVKSAAGDRKVIDFGLRRMHGADAGLRSARAFHVAGIDATSNVLAGREYGVAVTGTMAHSWIQAFDDELEAFRAFVRSHPETVLLVDTWDTLEGVRNVVRLADELGDDFGVRGIRLDSGNLGDLARESRKMLDEAGLEQVAIFASGGLDEWKIRDLLESGVPIDGFGVGTGMGVARDAPALDIAYKLTSWSGRGRMKLSTGKSTLPGRKQAFRMEEGGEAVRDLIGRADEELPGRPLLRKVMEGGRRLAAGRQSLDEARYRFRDELSRLPERVRGLEPADPAYPVEVSDELEEFRNQVEARVQAENTGE